MSDRQSPNFGALVCGLVAALSPFDLAIPRAGWTDLFLRPLWAISALGAVGALIARRDHVDRRLAGAVVVVVAAVVFAAAVSDDPTAGFAVAIRVAVVFGLFLAASASFGSAASQRLLLTALIAGALSASVVGITVYLAGEDVWLTRHLLGSISVTNGVQRLTRPFSQANVAAMYLAPVCAILIVAGVSDSMGERTERRKALLLAAGILAAVAVSLTLSRSGNIALGVALGGFVWLNRRKAGQIMVPALVVIGLLAARVVGPAWSERVAPLPASIGRRPLGRRDIWSQALEAFVNNPVTGVGTGQFGTFSVAKTPDGFAAAPHAHSVPLEFLATGGLLLFLPLVALAAFALMIFRAGFFEVPVALTAGAVAVIVHMGVDYPLVFSSSGNLVAVVLGSAIAHAIGGSRSFGMGK